MEDSEELSFQDLYIILVDKGIGRVQADVIKSKLKKKGSMNSKNL
jgi:hypothetical protein